MFRPFQRLDDIAQTTGVGLGLAVAKGFVAAMGGCLTAQETPGGGLTMVVRLPLSTGSTSGPDAEPPGAAGHSPPAPPAPVLQRAAAQRTIPPEAATVTGILVVDDDPHLLEGLEDHPAGARVQRGHRAGRSTRPCWRPPATRPDVVVLDLGLPDMDGRQRS